jgi:DNA-binding XRE family transcriptional regulator
MLDIADIRKRTLFVKIDAGEESAERYEGGAGLVAGGLAERLGVLRQSVNAIGTGKYDRSLPRAFKIGGAFAVGIDQIFSQEPE